LMRRLVVGFVDTDAPSTEARKQCIDTVGEAQYARGAPVLATPEASGHRGACGGID